MGETPGGGSFHVQWIHTVECPVIGMQLVPDTFPLVHSLCECGMPSLYEHINLTRLVAQQWTLRIAHGDRDAKGSTNPHLADEVLERAAAEPDPEAVKKCGTVTILRPDEGGEDGDREE